MQPRFAAEAPEATSAAPAAAAREAPVSPLLPPVGNRKARRNSYSVGLASQGAYGSAPPLDVLKALGKP